jgi:hypothetical protein
MQLSKKNNNLPLFFRCIISINKNVISKRAKQLKMEIEPGDLHRRRLFVDCWPTLTLLT